MNQRLIAGAAGALVLLGGGILIGRSLPDRSAIEGNFPTVRADVEVRVA